MKIFALVCIAFGSVAFTVLVTRVTCKEEKKNEVSNDEISDMLKYILKRLDKIEENVQANRDGTKEVQNEVKNISKDVSEVKAVLNDVLPGKTEGKPAESCPWIKNRSYCARSGHFWIKDEGKPTLHFCDMDEKKPVTTVTPTTAHPTTTAGPTTTAHQSSTVPPTTQPIFRDASCKDLKTRYPHLKTGMYNITVGLFTFEVFCDMETDNGGWTMVGKAVVNNESEAKEVHYETIQRDDFHQLHNVTSGRFLLSTKGLNSLYNTSKFTELRFQCFKPYHGRHLDVKTKGRDVLEWLLGRRSLYPAPPSCGTFTQLPEDRSFLGGHCDKWTGGGDWCRREIFYEPMCAYDGRRLYSVSLDYCFQRLLCDDVGNHPNFNNKGSWSFYVR